MKSRKSSGELLAQLHTEVHSPPATLNDLRIWMAGIQGLIYRIDQAQRREERALKAQKAG